jgi:transposase
MSISEPMHMSKPAAEPARRIEVFTGSGRRRSWSVQEKARIVAESYVEGDTVCGVARRHGLTPQQLFSWRRQARQPVAAMLEAPRPLFVPAVVEPDPGEPRREAKRRKRSEPGATATIELEIDGVTVRIGRGADAKTIMAVIRGLKAGA